MRLATVPRCIFHFFSLLRQLANAAATKGHADCCFFMMQEAQKETGRFIKKRNFMPPLIYLHYLRINLKLT